MSPITAKSIPGPPTISPCLGVLFCTKKKYDEAETTLQEALAIQDSGKTLRVKPS